MTRQTILILGAAGLLGSRIDEPAKRVRTMMRDADTASARYPQFAELRNCGAKIVEGDLSTAGRFGR